MADLPIIGIIGAGTMGSGIAHVFARSGYPVLLCDVEQRFLDRALSRIRTNLDREAAKGKIDAAAIDLILARITPHTTRDALSHVAIAVEAAHERFDLKADIFRSLDAILPPARSSPPTPRRSPSPGSPPSLAAPPRSSACTSSIPYP